MKRCRDCGSTWTGEEYEDIACTCPIGSEPQFFDDVDDSVHRLIADLSAPRHTIPFPAAQQFVSALVWTFSGQPWSRRDRRAFANSVRRRPRRVQHDGRVTR